MTTLPIDGHRVRLRDMTFADLPVWERWMLPGNAWQELDGPYYPKPSVNDVKTMIAKARSRIEAGGWPDPRQRLVIADATSDHFLGLVTATWESKETHWLLIGIVLFDPASWRKGLGYEALGLWCEYLLERMPELVRLDLRTWSGNHGMMALAQKLGFSEEARFRNARIVNVEYFDGMGYGILREEWETHHPSGFASRLRA